MIVFIRNSLGNVLGLAMLNLEERGAKIKPPQQERQYKNYVIPKKCCKKSQIS
jgi:hypothetical protein